ncbi:FecR family protein [Parabacteroides sp. AF17-3]|uniref:FecR family protein n=1 Tax=Parabacteroides sp. AF17-3 TaxID=2293113 RepID=UPI000EFE771D|nr:FecR family protein [Parabacteroides sp. AF17-3]RKU68078.1 FecR family protein [Parabacteroides sp. AF17-3]
MDQKEIKQLFRKYLDDQLSSEEIIRLKILIGEMDESTFTNNLYPLWESFQPSGHHNREAFDEISKNLKTTINPVKKISLINYIQRSAVAACLLILIVSTYYFYNENNSILTLNTQEHKISTENGERASVILPDGTKVFLNAGTILSYPALFDNKQRAVYLEGEAYFEVKHNESVPFIVQTSTASVKVLGTTFNVYAYSNKRWFETTLISGQVQVTMHKSPDKPVILSPNQKLRYNSQTGNFNTSNTDLRLETAWHKGDLIFRSGHIKEIFEQIATFYGIHFHIEGNYPEKLFTGNYHEEDVNLVLRNLQQHYAFTYQKKGDDIYIKFK